ncbi:MarR family winged helix-turn-helix transcriptional regulator [Parenemella sanctibonifatiensis]|nr:MarR family transcriptional regulator [Parenemella sanctibonifatiensis]
MDTYAAEDEVEGLIEAWHQVRPDLDTAPMAVLSRVHRISQQLAQLRATAYAKHDLEIWEFDVLAALRRAGEPYTRSPGQLVAETHVTSGTMTNRVGRLLARGLVERSSHPSDKRGVVVRLTPAGLDLVDGAISDLLDAERELLADMSAADQQTLAGLLSRLMG